MMKWPTKLDPTDLHCYRQDNRRRRRRGDKVEDLVSSARYVPDLARQEDILDYADVAYWAT